MSFKHEPETNSFGLVLPPPVEELSFLVASLDLPEDFEDGPTTHHLYWPRKLYEARGPQSRNYLFRNNRFNLMAMSSSEQRAYHGFYDGISPPPRKVITEFLREDKILKDIEVKVGSIAVIDSNLEKGTRYRNRNVNRRIGLVEKIGELSSQVTSFEVIPSTATWETYRRDMRTELARLGIEEMVDRWNLTEAVAA